MTDPEFSRREALAVLGSLATTVAANVGTVGATGETTAPAQTAQGFDPVETDLGQWSCMRGQTFDSHTFHDQRRISQAEELGRSVNWNDIDPDEPRPYFTWSWPEMVLDDDGTPLLRPSSERYTPQDYDDLPEPIRNSYQQEDIDIVDGWTSRTQLRFDYPGVLDLVDVMYVPWTDSWRYSFLYFSSGHSLQYRGTPSHAHDNTPTSGDDHVQPPVVREHAIGLQSEHDETLSFITAQGEAGTEHAIGYPIPAESDLTLEELERELGEELERMSEAQDTTDFALEAVATAAFFFLLSRAIGGPYALAAEFVIRVSIYVVNNIIFGPPEPEPPDQIDVARWSYGDPDESHFSPKSHAQHSRVWAVDVPAGSTIDSDRQTFEVRDRFDLEQRLLDTCYCQTMTAPGGDEVSQLVPANPVIRTQGQYHVTLPVLPAPEDMSPATREHYDVRPYCHPDREGCYYKAFSALPEVAYTQQNGFAVESDASE